MREETFETQREFNLKFPSKIYVCSRCGYLTPDKYKCTKCGNQSNNFIFTDNAYKYTIVETGITEQIFTPIELRKGENS